MLGTPGKGSRSAVPTAIIESSAEQRRRERDETTARHLVMTLERQARAIVDAAGATEGDDTVHGFSKYQAFRRQVSEFESLCTVIETSLGKVAEAPRGVLEELFHTRRDMILGPSIRAMTAFFTRLAAGGPLPFGLFDILESELTALGTMREALDGAETPSRDDAEIRAQIDGLETIIRDLRGRATQFADFSEASVVEALLPPEEAPEEPVETETPPEDDAAQLNSRETPELRAVQTIRELLEARRTDPALGQHVEIDLRALGDIERRLVKNPSDESAAKWLRHICNAWGSRMRGKEHVFMRLAAEIS